MSSSLNQGIGSRLPERGGFSASIINVVLLKP
jgi:hypothetical protein